VQIRAATGLVLLAQISFSATLMGCGSLRPRITGLKEFNLIFINIDALRADHLKCYGYARNTSPFLDSLAAQGVRYERAHSNSAYTRESVATLMSGLLPSSSGSVGWYAHPFEGEQNLAETFRAAGYRTGLFTLTTMLDHPQFSAGFDEAEHLTDVWGLSRAGPRLSSRALEFVRASAGRKFMMYLHYLDPHGPYDPPEELFRRFRPVSFPQVFDVYAHVRSHLDLLVAHGFGPGDVRFEDMVARYDAEILDTDAAIRDLFAGLKTLGVLDRTLVVVSADHGEEFLEHGFVEHAWTLYQESLHIPLLLWAPTRLPPLRIDARVSVVDYLPTILSLMEIPHQRRDFDGTALFQRRGKTFRSVAPASPLIAEMLIPERSVLRAIIRDDWKYIVAQKWLRPEERPAAIRAEEKLHGQGLAPSFDLWGPATHEELYHLSEDPRESRSVSASAPERVAALRAQLEEYRGRCLGGPASRRLAEEPTPADLEKLRSLGYVN